MLTTNITYSFQQFVCLPILYQIYSEIREIIEDRSSPKKFWDMYTCTRMHVSNCYIKTKAYVGINGYDPSLYFLSLKYDDFNIIIV